MSKRGLTVQSALIGIIITVLAAAIIFLFLKSLPYKEMTEKEACRQSVELRNKWFLKGELFGIEVPLNCKTQYITISSTNEEYIKKEIANAIYDCWWMLGEGEKNFFMRDPTPDNPAFCVICAVIEFDEHVQKKLPEVKGLNAYLFDTKIPQKNITYWEYLGGGKIQKLLDVAHESLNTTKKYAIVYSLIERSTLIEATGGGAAIGFLGGAIGGAIGTIALPGLGTVGGIAIGKAVGVAIGSIAGVFTGWKAGDILAEIIQEGDYAVVFTFVPFEAEAIKKLHCQSIESIP